MDLQVASLDLRRRGVDKRIRSRPVAREPEPVGVVSHLNCESVLVRAWVCDVIHLEYHAQLPSHTDRGRPGNVLNVGIPRQLRVRRLGRQVLGHQLELSLAYLDLDRGLNSAWLGASNCAKAAKECPRNVLLLRQAQSLNERSKLRILAATIEYRFYGQMI